MKKLVVTAMFALFAAASFASANEPGPVVNVFDPVCTPPYVQCTLECGDLSTTARASCLRECRIERDQCLAGHAP